ncbi:MAG: M48 family metallopeptidase [Clostridiales bacterium]|nr:M48 family metallopeptidase [Clostridiales bacterium]
MSYKYTLLRSQRRTLAVEIKQDLKIYVRAPENCPQEEIDSFLARQDKWIEEHLEKMRLKPPAKPEPSPEEKDKYISLAKEQIPSKVAYFGDIMGLSPAGISITGAKTRFGSCSAKNRLCFSWRLMQYPDKAIDYVVVHELAHLVHKNHGSQFYDLIESVMPDYKERKKLLRG